MGQNRRGIRSNGQGKLEAGTPFVEDLVNFNPDLMLCCSTIAVFCCVFCREITLEVSSAYFVKIPIAQGHAISIPIVSLIPAEKELFISSGKLGSAFMFSWMFASETAVLVYW